MSCARRVLSNPVKPVTATVLGLTFAFLVVVAAGRVHGAEPGPRASPITVQPNLGDINADGGIQFAPNGKYIAIGDRRQIKLWEIASGRPLRILEHTAYFEHFTFIEQGAQILSVHKDGEAKIWDPLTGRLLSSTKIDGIAPESHISAMLHHPEHNVVVITPQNGNVVIWDYRKREARGTFTFDSSKQNPQSAEGATLSTDGRMLVSAGGAALKRFDVATRRQTSMVRLRTDLRVVPSGMIDQSLVVAKTSDNDCDADLVLVTLADVGPRYATLDRAPGCKKTPDGVVEDNSILLVHNKAKGALYISRQGAPSTKVLDLAASRSSTGGLPLKDVKGSVEAVDPSGSLAAVGDGKSMKIVKLSDGSQVSSLIGHGDSGVFPIASAHGKQLMLHHTDAGVEKFSVWPIDGVAPTFHQVRLPAGFSARHAVPDANLVLADDGKGRFVVHSTLTGEQVASFYVPNVEEVNIARLSPDGKHVILYDPVDLIDTKTGNIVYQFEGRKAASADSVADVDMVRSFAFSADGQHLAVGWLNGGAEIWNVQPPRLIKRLDDADDQTTSLAFSPDNRFLIGGSRDSGVFVWSLETGKLLRTLERTSVAGHVSTGSVAISQDSELVAAGPLQRAHSSGDVGRERRVQVWDLASGEPRFLLSGHEANVNALLFTSDGRWIVSGSNDGTIRYWDRRTGSLGATFAAALDGRWVMVTDRGFFAASANAGDLLSVVRGFEATSIDQMWQSLYAPDLVREHLAGDPNGEMKVAAVHADLQKVLSSGPAPDVAIMPPALAGTSARDLIEVEARITDNGKGVGRIEWRVNGITTAVAAKPTGGGPDFLLTQRLALDPGDNTIEVIAYNASNLLASLPARTTVNITGSANRVKPKLHVLAIGINAYVDKGWKPAGSADILAFPPLNLAVSDAKALAAAFKQAGSGQYAEVRVTEALDTEATAAGLQQIIERMASEIDPRDTFVLFAAAHGTSNNGRFYLIPQDYDGGTNPVSLQERAIGQDRLQDWVANQIKAKKTILLLDTCESGALVGGYTRSRTDVPAAEAAIGRLHEATGRPVLTAAAEGKPAFEGYEGHGVFTWALLDALKNGDRNGNGYIELSELVAHVQDKVPMIAARLNGRGRAAVATRGSTDDRQSARFGSRGEDFALVRQLQ
jgi:WD40 repeat protein